MPTTGAGVRRREATGMSRSTGSRGLLTLHWVQVQKMCLSWRKLWLRRRRCTQFATKATHKLVLSEIMSKNSRLRSENFQSTSLHGKSGTGRPCSNTLLSAKASALGSSDRTITSRLESGSRYHRFESYPAERWPSDTEL
jgi:hypothetical protein